MVDWNTHVPFGSTGLEVSRLGIGSSFVKDAAICTGNQHKVLVRVQAF